MNVGFVSRLLSGEPVIGDANAHRIAPANGSVVIQGDHYGRGMIPRDRRAHPKIYGAQPFDMELIPESEWAVMLEQQEKEKSSLTDQILEAGLPPLNQQQTSFCWANSSTMVAQILRMQEGEPQVPLSPASVACPINGFRNQGGWCGQSITRIADNGIAPQSLWPANAIDRQYFTDAEQAEAAKYRIQKWIELGNRNFAQVATCMLKRKPCAVDFNWWSHSVAAIGLVRNKDGTWGLRIYNSWGTTFGTNGMAVLTGSKMVPDDAVCGEIIMAKAA